MSYTTVTHSAAKLFSLDLVKPETNLFQLRPALKPVNVHDLFQFCICMKLNLS